MESSYNFPQDDYALAILTQAAMSDASSNPNNLHPQNNTDTSNAGYQPQRRPVSRVGGASASTTLNPSAGNASITHPQHHDQRQNLLQRQGHQGATTNVTQPSRIPNLLHDYNPAAISTRSMDTLGYSTTQSSHQPHQNAYMNSSSGYHHNGGIGAQTSSNYASSLGILNAESYDDGRGSMRASEASKQRVKAQQETIMPFGITDTPRVEMETDGGSGRRRKKPRLESHSADDDEEARKKARGRPRVDTKDETAADRRRTQIRMAQRAYRHRKETTISSLEKQVQDLRGTNEEMSNIFINLYDFAVGKGLLQREPEFGHQLQSTTERFLALAKASANDDSNHEEDLAEEAEKHDKVVPEPVRRQKGRKASPKKQEPTPPISEPVNPWGGYSLTREESPAEEIPMDYQHNGYTSRYRSNDLQVITRATEDNASFPFEFDMDLQQFRVEVPSIDDFSQSFLPKSQPPLPFTYTYSEYSFARRLQRNATERALQFITMENPSPERMQRIFGISLKYGTKEDIIQRCKAVLASTNKETLHQWKVPFVHIGGSGTFYPMHDMEIDGALMPKIRTGYSMGPFSSSVTEVQEAMNDDLRCSLPGFEGDFFDPNDVEGYLRGRGVDIPPSADYVTAEIDIAALVETPVPNSTSSTIATVSPRTPLSPIDNLLRTGVTSEDKFVLDYLGAEGSMDAFSMGYTNWDISMQQKGMENIDGIFSTPDEQHSGRRTPEITMNNRTDSKKRLVTINVATLLDELISRGVCLGRAPGFRPSDVNIAIIAAIKEAGFVL